MRMKGLLLNAEFKSNHQCIASCSLENREFCFKMRKQTYIFDFINDNPRINGGGEMEVYFLTFILFFINLRTDF